MAEQCGMNAILTNPALCAWINDYWKKEGGQDPVHFRQRPPDGLIRGAQLSCRERRVRVYTHGGVSDGWAKNGDAKKFEETLGGDAQAGGAAGHRRASPGDGQVLRGPRHHPRLLDENPASYQVLVCAPEAGYYSKDNVWCLDVDDVVAYMEKLGAAWIAFKILAAGALRPQESFPFAFKSGADFICVGMYDFQVVDNVNLLNDVLAARSSASAVAGLA
jgi:hypothetical protein